MSELLEGEGKRRAVWISEKLWEATKKEAIKASQREGEAVSAAEIVRRALLFYLVDQRASE